MFPDDKSVIQLFNHKDGLQTALFIAMSLKNSIYTLMTTGYKELPSHCHPLLLLKEILSELEIRGLPSNVTP